MDQRNHKSNSLVMKVPIEDLRQLSTGVHLCHLLNQLTEGKFKLGKVNKSPKTEAESFKNLRIFNEGLENLGFEQKFDVHNSKIRST